MPFPKLLFALFVLFLLFIFLKRHRKFHHRPDFFEPKPQESSILLNEYKRKEYLFDSNSEFILFKALIELFGDQFHVFPQVGYSHLIDETSHNFYEKRRFRSRIDRKSADFVFCDKEHVLPRLVIELNGDSHSLPERKERDNLINTIAKHISLPILTLDVRDIHDKNLIREKVLEKLN